MNRKYIDFVPSSKARSGANRASSPRRRVVREVREETGLTIYNPALCGVKQFPLKDGKYENGRYLVF